MLASDNILHYELAVQTAHLPAMLAHASSPVYLSIISMALPMLS
jgi:hypothetical protein